MEEESCLYQNHTKTYLLKYIKEKIGENCLNCIKNKMNEQCKNYFPCKNSKKENLLEIYVNEYNPFTQVKP